MWKNISSYSQGTQNKKPISFQMVQNNVRIVVTRHIHFPPDVWVASCNPWFSLLELKNKNIEDAKKEAIEIVVANLQKTIDSLTA